MKNKPKKHQSAMLREYYPRVEIFKEKRYRTSAMLREYIPSHNFERVLHIASIAALKPKRKK